MLQKAARGPGNRLAAACCLMISSPAHRYLLFTAACCLTAGEGAFGIYKQNKQRSMAGKLYYKTFSPTSGNMSIRASGDRSGSGVQ